MQILIVEDERSLRESIEEYLCSNGHNCTSVGSYRKGMEKTMNFSYDCVLIDVGLPDGNGIDLIKRYPANIVSDSIELIKEWRGYMWKYDKSTNKYLNEPEDINNHGIDPIRYGASAKLKPTLKAATFNW